MSRLTALYPTTWRDRYGDEFEAVLTARPPSVSERVDIVRGALDAHLHPQVPGPVRIPDRYGFGPLIGLASLVAALLLAANGPLHYDEYGTYRDGVAAIPFFVLAMILLDVGLYRVVLRLPDGAAWAGAAGLIAIVAGPTWAFMPWVVPIGLIFIVGVLGLAVGARRAGIMPAWALVVLVAALAVPAGLFAATPFVPWYTLRESGLNFGVVLGSMTIVWLVFGGLLLRGFPERSQG
jgi:hypothetical protein